MAEFPPKYKKYVEVFGGAGWVLFHKNTGSEVEIFNDINGDLINLFRCVKHHAREFVRQFHFILGSRELFNEFKAQTDGLTDIQRAARFFYILKYSYGSKIKNSSFAGGSKKSSLYSVLRRMIKIQKRLESVTIERLDYKELISKHDSKDTLFYLDPPYFGSERMYNTDFGISDHKELAEILSKIKGRFVLSYNDCEFIRELYKGFKIIEVERTNNLSTGTYKELIITK